ncbi:unnamed protein product [Lota lota]
MIRITHGSAVGSCEDVMRVQRLSTGSANRAQSRVRLRGHCGKSPLHHCSGRESALGGVAFKTGGQLLPPAAGTALVAGVHPVNGAPRF